MDQIARTPRQIGAAIRRRRKQLGLSQARIGERVLLRQATLSSAESGDPGTKLGTLLDILTALDLELVIRPRTKSSALDIEELF
jgi:HTH-type transcriptional regulator/antitoxin HipB